MSTTLMYGIMTTSATFILLESISQILRLLRLNFPSPSFVAQHLFLSNGYETLTQNAPSSLPSAPVSALRDARFANHELARHRRMYHQLHNLEENSSFLPEARDTLVSLLSAAISGARGSRLPNILAMDTFDADALVAFIREQDQAIAAKFETYDNMRSAGGPRELFQTAEEARTWLTTRAPSKLVDGAWVGHVNCIGSTPFELLPFTKGAWQVLSEELGDGDQNKHHAALYRELLEKVSADLPEAHSAAFVERADDLGMSDLGTWQSAVAQLLISLFPHEFLPEILGFNLHFETLTFDTVRAARELREVGLDNYYFLLHISIDNVDSGHVAMAVDTVVNYLQHVLATQGDEALQRAWRGVQAGYLLSQSAVGGDGDNPDASHNLSVNNRFAPELLRILQSKASVSARLHCASRAQIGGKKLSEWLDHGKLQAGQGQDDFLGSLARARPWIIPGDSSRSKLVSALQWSGKMFGAFTESEVQALCHWIDALGEVDQSLYGDFIGRHQQADRLADDTVQLPDVRLASPVFDSRGLSTPWKQQTPSLGDEPTLPTFEPLPRIALSVTDAARRLQPIWFAHIALLEGMVSTPTRTCDTSGCAVIRVLRAQRGFAAEGAGVAGMDEMRRADPMGLVAVGLDMSRRAGLAEPRRLADAVPSDSPGPGGDFALDLLHWSMRPVQHRSALMGMAWSFVGLHDCLAAQSCDLVSHAAKDALVKIAERERDGLAICKRELIRDPEQGREFEAAAAFAWAKIVECLVRV